MEDVVDVALDDGLGGGRGDGGAHQVVHPTHRLHPLLEGGGGEGEEADLLEVAAGEDAVPVQVVEAKEPLQLLLQRPPAQRREAPYKLLHPVTSLLSPPPSSLPPSALTSKLIWPLLSASNMLKMHVV